MNQPICVVVAALVAISLSALGCTAQDDGDASTEGEAASASEFGLPPWKRYAGEVLVESKWSLGTRFGSKKADFTIDVREYPKNGRSVSFRPTEKDDVCAISGLEPLTLPVKTYGGSGICIINGKQENVMVAIQDYTYGSFIGVSLKLGSFTIRTLNHLSYQPPSKG